MDDLAPGAKPKFMEPAADGDLEYPGIVEPTFDEEADSDNDPSSPVPVGTDVPGGSQRRGITERWRAVARLHALGQRNTIIAKKLGYTETGVAKILKQPWVQAEVRRLRGSYESDIVARVKDAALDGVERIHRIILDEDEKSNIVLDASKWAVEKTTGKAKQEVSHESGTLAAFMDLMRGMQARGETLDITPATPREVGPDQPGTHALPGTSPGAAMPPDQWDSWLDDNL